MGQDMLWVVEMEDIVESKVESKSEKTKNRYIFPNWLAKTMNNVSFRTQNEASLLSQFLLIIGMILMVIYIVIYGGQSIGYKILLVVNMLCGIVFMGSYIVTTYQQYKSYMDTMGIDSDYEKQKVKSKGNIFKRIRTALIERKRAKKAEKVIENIGTLMETSGMAKETSSEEKNIDAEIDEMMNDNKPNNERR